MRRTRSWRTTSASPKVDAGDALDARQDAHRLDQARLLPWRQVDLGRVAVDDHARAFAEARQEHLHLHRGGVLRLVEQHDGVGERATAHEGQRRHLDHAGLEAALDVPRLHEVVKGVVDRPQVRIDLLAHVARQKAEPLAGLHGRPRQDQAFDLPLLEKRDRMADRKPGLARSGRTFGEDEFVRFAAP